MKELKNFSLFTLLLVALPLFVLSSPVVEQKPTDHPYDHFTHLSYRLILAVQKYRKDLGQAHLPISPSLFSLAHTHVEDLKENFAALLSVNCTSPLSWSSSKASQGKWRPCCLSLSNATALMDCSVDKASEILIGYEGLAKEVIVQIGDETNVDRILDLFLQQKNFLSVIAGSGNYRFVEWRAIGAAVDGGFASLWFGNAVDKAKWHNGTSAGHDNSPIPTPEGQKVKCDFLDGLDEGAAVVETLSVFRAQSNFSSVPISPTLMKLARLHVKDLYAKYYTRTGAENECSESSWFNTTGYSCCAPAGPNGADSVCVHQAPKKVVNYDGDAFEIVYVDKNKDANLEPLDVLTRVLKNPLFNAVIFNERLSENQDFTYAKWLAAGAAVKGGVASLWIGDTEDLVECIADPNTKTTSKTTIVTNADGSTTTVIETSSTTSSTSTTTDIIEEVNQETVVSHVTYHRYDFAEPAYSLASLVNKHRTANKLAALSPSPSLFAVADLHVDNLVKSRAELKKKNCSSLLSWGGEVHWAECCVGAKTSKNCSTNKPSEVSKDYTGKASEFIIKISKEQTPEQAFNALLKKADFKTMLLSDSVTTLGAEFDQGYASVWLGTGVDSATWFKKPAAATGNVKTR